MDETNQATDQPNIVDLLTSILSPSEAGAASSSDQWVARFLANQAESQRKGAEAADQRRASQQAGFQHQEKMLKERQAGQQADPLYQAKDAAAQRKAQPKPTPAEILGGGQGGAGQVYAPDMPGEVLGGGPGAPITFGRNPRTGGYSFNNFGWVTSPGTANYGEGQQPTPDWVTGRAGEVAQRYSTPQMQQQVDQARQQMGKTGGTDSSQLTPDRLDQLGKLAEGLKAVPESQRSAALRAVIPGLNEAEQSFLEAQSQLRIKEKTTESAATKKDTALADLAKAQKLATDMFKQNAPVADIASALDPLGFAVEEVPSKFMGLGGGIKVKAKGASEQPVSAQYTSDQKATAAQLIARASKQLGPGATPQQIKDLARKLQSQKP